MTTYHVHWEIEIDAETPEEAACQALNIQRDPASIATVFEVTKQIFAGALGNPRIMGPSVTVDLGEG